MSYSFVYGSYTSTTGGSNFVRPYIYYQITVTEDNVNCHWWAGCDVKSGWTTNAKFTMTTSVSDGSAINRSVTLDNQGWKGGAHAMIKDIDYNWDRGTSSRTLTLKATLKPYGKSASTATLSITIPALNQYTVTFNSTGGTTCASQKRYYGYGVGLPAPTRVGYEFLGWSTANDNTIGSGDYPKTTTTMTVTKNITLYAAWKVTYVAPTVQGNVIGYRVSSETASIPREASDGTMAYIEFTTNSGTNVSYDNSADITYTASYAVNGGTAKDFTLIRKQNTYTYSGIIGSEGDFNIGTSYTIKVQVTNKSTSDTGAVDLITTTTFTLPKQVYAIDIAANSRRVAFGGVATDNQTDFGIESYGNIYFKRDVPTSTTKIGLCYNYESFPLFSSDGTNAFIYDNTIGKFINMSSTLTAPTITKSSGNCQISQIQARKWGPIVQLHFMIKSDSATASSGNFFVGTIQDGYKPAVYVSGVGFYGARAIVCRITTDGEIMVRNTYSDSVTPTEGIDFGLTYIVQ